MKHWHTNSGDFADQRLAWVGVVFRKTPNQNYFEVYSCYLSDLKKGGWGYSLCLKGPDLYSKAFQVSYND